MNFLSVQHPDAFLQSDERAKAAVSAVQAAHPRPARGSIYGYAMHKAQVLHYPDVRDGPGVPQGLRQSAEWFGNNSGVYAHP